MNAAPALRPATRADVPALRELARRIWWAHYPGIVPDAQIAYMLERMYDADTIARELAGPVVWELAELGGAPAGFLAWEPRPAEHHLWLHKLYLAPEHHGRGHGQRLLAHVFAQARRLGLPAVDLAVNRRNARALHAYERAGFQTLRAQVKDIGGGFVMDDFILRRVLAE
jgi:diamine N-acetyltransferase